jgi:hypothetical protein
MYRAYIVFALFAVSVYSWAQYHGYTAFGSARPTTAAPPGTSRIYHK